MNTPAGPGRWQPGRVQAADAARNEIRRAVYAIARDNASPMISRPTFRGSTRPCPGYRITHRNADRTGPSNSPHDAPHTTTSAPPAKPATAGTTSAPPSTSHQTPTPSRPATPPPKPPTPTQPATPTQKPPATTAGHLPGPASAAITPSATAACTAAPQTTNTVTTWTAAGWPPPWPPGTPYRKPNWRQERMTAQPGPRRSADPAARQDSECPGVTWRIVPLMRHGNGWPGELVCALSDVNVLPTTICGVCNNRSRIATGTPTFAIPSGTSTEIWLNDLTFSRRQVNDGPGAKVGCGRSFRPPS